MRRTVFALIAAILLAIVGFHPASARQETPTVGVPVVVPGPDGGHLATVAVTELTDPYEGYDPGSPPPRGFHYVAATSM